MSQEEDNAVDQGTNMMQKFVNLLMRRFLQDEQGERDMTSGELNIVRIFMSDNSITFARVRGGEFGKVAKELAQTEEFMFDANDNPATPN